jgi:hypothetical protein
MNSIDYCRYKGGTYLDNERWACGDDACVICSCSNGIIEQQTGCDTDGSADASVDATPDSSNDAEAEVSIEGSVQASPDAGSDGSVDAERHAPGDAMAGAAGDGSYAD